MKLLEIIKNIESRKKSKWMTLVVLLCSIAIPFTSNAQNKINNMKTATELTSLIKDHFDLLNTYHSKDRIERLEKNYAEDFHIIDTHFENFGIAEFNKAIDQIHEKVPGKKFIITEDIVLLNNAAKAVWKLGDTIMGEDIFIFREGKIFTVVAFVKTVDPVKNK